MLMSCRFNSTHIGQIIGFPWHPLSFRILFGLFELSVNSYPLRMPPSTTTTTHVFITFDCFSFCTSWMASHWTFGRQSILPANQWFSSMTNMKNAVIYLRHGDHYKWLDYIFSTARKRTASHWHIAAVLLQPSQQSCEPADAIKIRRVAATEILFCSEMTYSSQLRWIQFEWVRCYSSTLQQADSVGLNVLFSRELNSSGSAKICRSDNLRKWLLSPEFHSSGTAEICQLEAARFSKFKWVRQNTSTRNKEILCKWLLFSFSFFFFFNFFVFCWTDFT